MKKFIATFALVLVIVPFFALAAPCQINKDNKPPITPDALPQCINQIYVWSLGVGALLGVLMLVIGGYYYMTAGGNAERSGKGVEIIWGTVIGLALLFGAYLLLNTINPDLVNFSNFTKDFKCVDDPKAAGCPQPPPTAPRTSP